MIIIGLTGSIAMGKSEVANILRTEGLPVFDADQEVHALYDSEQGADLLKDLAPDAIVNGRVDRQRLSRIVVEKPQCLEQLETIIHAEIARRRKTFTTNAEAEGHGIIGVDIPLLFEKAGDKDVDVTIVVSAPGEIQHKRALARPGMTEKKLEMILNRQMSDAEKQRRADYVIHNTGTLAELRRETLAVLAAIRKEHRL
jgi:dephospho-CoA kinase